MVLPLFILKVGKYRMMALLMPIGDKHGDDQRNEYRIRVSPSSSLVKVGLNQDQVNETDDNTEVTGDRVLDALSFDDPIGSFRLPHPAVVPGLKHENVPQPLEILQSAGEVSRLQPTDLPGIQQSRDRTILRAKHVRGMDEDPFSTSRPAGRQNPS